MAKLEEAANRGILTKKNNKEVKSLINKFKRGGELGEDEIDRLVGISRMHELDTKWNKWKNKIVINRLFLEVGKAPDPEKLKKLASNVHVLSVIPKERIDEVIETLEKIPLAQAGEERIKKVNELAGSLLELWKRRLTNKQRRKLKDLKEIQFEVVVSEGKGKRKVKKIRKKKVKKKEEATEEGAEEERKTKRVKKIRKRVVKGGETKEKGETKKVKKIRKRVGKGGERQPTEGVAGGAPSAPEGVPGKGVEELAKEIEENLGIMTAENIPGEIGELMKGVNALSPEERRKQLEGILPVVENSIGEIDAKTTDEKEKTKLILATLNEVLPSFAGVVSRDEAPRVIDVASEAITNIKPELRKLPESIELIINVAEALASNKAMSDGEKKEVLGEFADKLPEDVDKLIEGYIKKLWSAILGIREFKEELQGKRGAGGVPEEEEIKKTSEELRNTLTEAGILEDSPVYQDFLKRLESKPEERETILNEAKDFAQGYKELSEKLELDPRLKNFLLGHKMHDSEDIIWSLQQSLISAVDKYGYDKAKELAKFVWNIPGLAEKYGDIGKKRAEFYLSELSELSEVGETYEVEDKSNPFLVAVEWEKIKEKQQKAEEREQTPATEEIGEEINKTVKEIEAKTEKEAQIIKNYAREIIEAEGVENKLNVFRKVLTAGMDQTIFAEQLAKEYQAVGLNSEQQLEIMRAISIFGETNPEFLYKFVRALSLNELTNLISTIDRYPGYKKELNSLREAAKKEENKKREEIERTYGEIENL